MLHPQDAVLIFFKTGQLREQCDDLSQQVQRLVEQVDHLSRLFITNSR
ncbi:MbeD/MobD family mobilization/exclusion protein [Escherichia coli]